MAAGAMKENVYNTRRVCTIVTRQKHVTPGLITNHTQQ